MCLREAGQRGEKAVAVFWFFLSRLFQCVCAERSQSRPRDARLRDGVPAPHLRHILIPATLGRVAKFLPGSIMSDIRGAVGSQVYSRNTFGPLIRTRTAPDPTVTARRGIVQAIWLTVAGRWNTALSNNQRTAWDVWAREAASSKSPLTPKALNGRSAFMRLNQRLGLYAAAYLDNPPLHQQVEQLTALGLTADADAEILSLTFAPSPLPANHAMVIFATAALNTGRMFSGDQQLFLLYLVPAATSPQNIYLEWDERSGPLPPAQKIFVRANLLNTTNGAYSIPLLASASNTGTGDPMYTVKHTLSAAEILTLFSVGHEVVPTPGAGKAIIVHKCLAYYHHVTTAYTIGAGSQLILGPTALPTAYTAYAALNTLITGVSSRIGLTKDETTNWATANLLNQGLSVKCTVSDPTLGDGTLDLVIEYTIATP